MWITSPGAKLLANGICIHQDYNRFAEPDAEKTVTYSTIEKEDIRSVDDEDGTMSVDLTLVLRWLDPHLQTRLSKSEKDNDSIALTPEAIKEIWTPDIYVLDRKSFQIMDEWKSLKRAMILATKEFVDLEEPQYKSSKIQKTTVEMSYELKSTVYCDFKFSAYPMDEQTCDLKLKGGSNYSNFYLYDPNNRYHVKESYKAAGFQLSVTFLGKMDHSDSKIIGIRVEMRRDLTSFIMTYYIPCISIVLSCALGFVIPDYPEGRISLMVTLFLTLMTLFVNQMVGKNCRQFYISN